MPANNVEFARGLTAIDRGLTSKVQNPLSIFRGMKVSQISLAGRLFHIAHDVGSIDKKCKTVGELSFPVVEMAYEAFAATIDEPSHCSDSVCRDREYAITHRLEHGHGASLLARRKYKDIRFREGLVKCRLRDLSAEADVRHLGDFCLDLLWNGTKPIELYSLPEFAIRENRSEDSRSALVSIPTPRAHESDHAGSFLIKIPRMAGVDRSVVDDPTFRILETVSLDHRAMHVIRDANEMVDPIGVKGAKAGDDESIHVADCDEWYRQRRCDALKYWIVVVDAGLDLMIADML